MVNERHENFHSYEKNKRRNSVTFGIYTNEISVTGSYTNEIPVTESTSTNILLKNYPMCIVSVKVSREAESQNISVIPWGIMGCWGKDLILKFSRSEPWIVFVTLKPKSGM